MALVPGRYGQAWQTTSALEYLFRNEVLAHDNSEYTVAGWVKFSSSSVGGVLYAESSSLTLDSRFILRALNAGPRIRFEVEIVNDDGTVALLQGTVQEIPANNEWHHFAFVDDAGTATFYVDGVADSASFNYTKVAKTQDYATVGARISAAGVFEITTGGIDDLRVFSVALNASEVSGAAFDRWLTSSSLIGNANVILGSAQAGFIGTASLGLNGQVLAGASAVLRGTASLTGSPEPTTPEAAEFVGTAALGLVGTRFALGQLGITGTAALGLSATKLLSGVLVLPGVATLGLSASALALAQAEFKGEASMVMRGSAIVNASCVMGGTATLGLTADKLTNASIVMRGSAFTLFRAQRGPVPRGQAAHFAFEVQNPAGQLRAYLPNVLSANLTEELNKAATLSLRIPLADYGQEFLVFPNRILVRTSTGEQRGLFVIKETNHERNGTATVSVRCVDLLQQLAEEVIVNFRTTDLISGLTPQTSYSTLIAELLDLQVNTAPVELDPSFGVTFGIVSVQYSNISILQALEKIRDLTTDSFGINPLTGKLRWTTIAQGKDIGQRIRYQHNLTSMSRRQDFTDLVTKLFPFGAGEGDARVTISKSASAQVDFLDAASQAQWGILPRRKVFPQIEDPDALFDAATSFLAEHDQPVTSYDFGIADLSQDNAGDTYGEFEDIRVGDTVVIEDSEFGIDITAEVIKRTQELTRPITARIQVVNTRPTMTSTFDRILSERTWKTLPPAHQVFIDYNPEEPDADHPAGTTLDSWKSPVRPTRINKKKIDFANDPIQLDDLDPSIPLDAGGATSFTGTLDDIPDGSQFGRVVVGQLQAGQLNITSASVIQAGRIKTEEVGNSQITEPKLAPQSVSRGKILFDAVDTDQIASGAVRTAQINSQAVTTSKIMGLAVTRDKINFGAVGGGQIADGAIVTNKIADNAVRTDQLLNSSVTSAKIRNTDVLTAKIRNLAVTEAKLGLSAVTTDKIGSGAVTLDKLAPEVLALLTNSTAAKVITAEGTNIIVNGDFRQFTDPRVPSGAGSSGGWTWALDIGEGATGVWNPPSGPLASGSVTIRTPNNPPNVSVWWQDLARRAGLAPPGQAAFDVRNYARHIAYHLQFRILEISGGSFDVAIEGTSLQPDSFIASNTGGITTAGLHTFVVDIMPGAPNNAFPRLQWSLGANSVLTFTDVTLSKIGVFNEGQIR